MNWKEINKKYPKAFDLFFEWFKGDPKAGVTKKEFLEVNDIVIMYGNLRELYDFFDEQEIWITVYRMSKKDGFGWGWRIDEDIKGKFKKRNIYFPRPLINDSDIVLLARTDSEEAAFTKAFEILEEKILNN